MSFVRHQGAKKFIQSEMNGLLLFFQSVLTSSVETGLLLKRVVEGETLL